MRKLKMISGLLQEISFIAIMWNLESNTIYMPREESFPIPLKYFDVTRTTHTSLDVHAHMLQNNVDLVGCDFNMSAFSTVGDVFTDPVFRLQATLSLGAWCSVGL